MNTVESVKNLLITIIKEIKNTQKLDDFSYLNSNFIPNVFNYLNGFFVSAVYIPNKSKIVVGFSDSNNSGYGTIIVGTIVNGIIEFGEPVVFNNKHTRNINVVYIYKEDKVAIIYTDTGNNNYGTIVLGSINDNTIILNNPTVFIHASTSNISATYAFNENKLVIAYVHGEKFVSSCVILATVVDNYITFSDLTTFNEHSVSDISIAYNYKTSKLIIAYSDSYNLGKGTAIVGTIINDIIELGKPIVFTDTNIDYTSVVCDIHSNNAIIAYRDKVWVRDGIVIVGEIKDNTIKFNKSATFAQRVDAPFLISHFKENKIFLMFKGYENYDGLGKDVFIVGNIVDSAPIF